MEVFVPFLERETAEQTKNQWLILDSSENWGHKAKCHFESQGDREIQGILSSLPGEEIAEAINSNS